MARWLIIAGAVLLILGVVVNFAPGILSWFGKLPGDIRIERENSRVFIPITSMLLVSVVLSVVLNIFNR